MRFFTLHESMDDERSHYHQPRVSYAGLLETLKLPVVWSYDELLEAYVPGELPLEQVAQLKRGIAMSSQANLQLLWNAGLFEPRGRISKEALKASYKSDGFVRIPQLFGIDYAKHFMTPYYWRLRERHKRLKDMEGIKRTSANNLPLMRHLHQATERLVQYIVGEPLKTSYSFSSAYEAGSSLPPHTDRPQCVHNMSVMLGSEPRDVNLSEWPLWIKRPGRDHRVMLDQGDAVLYSGTRDLHWRDVMPKHLSSVLGVFFHYVEADFQGGLD
jgi:alkylated DNA repair dioxygenase AlkB